MMLPIKCLTLALAVLLLSACAARGAGGATGYDPDLARALGGDEHGMRSYVFVLLKTGPKPVPPGPQRDAMFQGHFANMEKLAAEGKLAVAGPFDKVDGWRGMFVLAVADFDEAKRLMAGDPVLASGEMVAEYHRYYGSAALMAVNETHNRIVKPGAP